jgi:hypothetical protein
MGCIMAGPCIATIIITGPIVVASVKPIIRGQFLGVVAQQVGKQPGYCSRPSPDLAKEPSKHRLVRQASDISEAAPFTWSQRQCRLDLENLLMIPPDDGECDNDKNKTGIKNITHVMSGHARSRAVGFDLLGHCHLSFIEQTEAPWWQQGFQSRRLSSRGPVPPSPTASRFTIGAAAG